MLDKEWEQIAHAAAVIDKAVRKCRSCWKMKPFVGFLGDGGQITWECAECREKRRLRKQDRDEKKLRIEDLEGLGIVEG